MVQSKSVRYYNRASATELTKPVIATHQFLH